MNKILLIFTIFSSLSFFSQKIITKEINEKTYSWYLTTNNKINAKDTIKIHLSFAGNKIEFEPVLSSFKSENINKIGFLETRPEYYTFKIKNNKLIFFNEINKIVRTFNIIKVNNSIKIIDRKSLKEYQLDNNHKRIGPPSRGIQ